MRVISVSIKMNGLKMRMTISIINKINSINHISKKAKSVLSLLVLMEFCGFHQEMVVSDCYSYFVWFQQVQTKHFLLIVKMKIHFELAQAILWAHSFHALAFSRWMLNVFSYDRIREPKLFCIKNKELIIVKQIGITTIHGQAENPFH